MKVSITFYIKVCFLNLTMFLTSMSHAQKTNNPNIILSISEESELNFFEYEPGLKLKATLSSLNEVKNKFPEELMQSILAARNQEWINYNTLGGEEKATKKEQSHFDKIIKMNKEKNYFELQHKLTFELGGVLTCIVKFYFYQENEKLVSGAYLLQKVNDRWYKTSSSSLSILPIIVMRMKSEVLSGIIYGDSEIEAIKEIRERTTTNGSLDLKKLEDEFASWYSPEKDEAKIGAYKDPKSW